MKKGTLLLLVGPSGSGKGSLIQYIRSVYPEILFSVSCTTRDMRPGEVDGVNYYFVSREEFQRRIDAGEFLEWAQYGGNLYGTLKSEVLPVLEAGGVILLEIEVQGVHQIQQLIPKEQLHTIFIDSGSWDDLEARIRSRAPISDEELEKRRMRYLAEVPFKDEADVVITNPDGGLTSAKEQFENIVKPFI